MNLDKLVAEFPNAEYRYSTFYDRNPLSGHVQVRRLSIPNPDMKILQKKFLEAIQGCPTSRACVGGQETNNATRAIVDFHVGHRYFYHLDLKSAFKNVNLERLAQIVYQDYPQERHTETSLNKIQEFLQQYCFNDKGHLATGACTSPFLYNIYLRELDNDFLKFCRGSTFYCRYLDDLIFSSSRPIYRQQRKWIREIIIAQGLQINPRKTRYYDLTKGPAVILGVGITLEGRIFVPGKYRRQLRGFIHLAQKDPLSFRKKVAGKMGAYHSIIPKNFVYLDQEIKTQSELKIEAEFEKLLKLAREQSSKIDLS